MCLDCEENTLILIRVFTISVCDEVYSSSDDTHVQTLTGCLCECVCVLMKACVLKGDMPS